MLTSCVTAPRLPASIPSAMNAASPSSLSSPASPASFVVPAGVSGSMVGVEPRRPASRSCCPTCPISSLSAAVRPPLRSNATSAGRSSPSLELAPFAGRDEAPPAERAGVSDGWLSSVIARVDWAWAGRKLDWPMAVTSSRRW